MRGPLRVIRYATVTSTQDVARRLAAAGAEEGTVVLADAQTAGRGRWGRRWHSPRGGGLWFSLILRPRTRTGGRFDPAAGQLSLVVAVAVARGLERAVGADLPIRLKWPNDLLAGGGKVAGILLEREPRSGAVVAGVGVNVSFPGGPPRDLPGAVDLVTALGRPVDREDILPPLLAALAEGYGAWRSEGFEPFRREWLGRFPWLHQPVTVAVGEEVVTGRAADLDEEGRLVLLLPDGSRRVLAAGEVAWRCPSPTSILFLSSSRPAGAHKADSPGQ